MSFFVATIPPLDDDPVRRGYGHVLFRVGGEEGRFDIEILVKTHLPEEGDTVYGDEGELTIRDRRETLPRGEGLMESVVRQILDRHTNMAQESCFSTSESVPAAPDNIVRAIQWCQANPKFMQDGQGI